MTKNQIQEHLRMDRFPVSRCAPIFDAGSERAQIEHPAGTANKRIPFGQRPTCTVADPYRCAGYVRYPSARGERLLDHALPLRFAAIGNAI